MEIGLKQEHLKDNRKMTQENSFPCRGCGEVFTEESGAFENFICEDCYEFKDMIMTYSDKTLSDNK